MQFHFARLAIDALVITAGTSLYAIASPAPVTADRQQVAPEPAQSPPQSRSPDSAVEPLPPTAKPNSSKPRRSEGGVPPCVSLADAGKTPDQDVCVTAHVFDVVQLSDGTRFLDVCPDQTPDQDCRFTILCPPEDQEIGDLRKYRDQDIHIRGVVHSMHGRMGIVLSHVRQFDGGPEKFRPNPRLLHNFNGQSDRMPIHDPNLRSSGKHRSFMNTHETESLPPAKKP